MPWCSHPHERHVCRVSRRGTRPAALQCTHPRGLRRGLHEPECTRVSGRCSAYRPFPASRTSVSHTISRATCSMVSATRGGERAY
eukprot:1756711-Prymnesium_polylepis.1